MNRQRLQQKTTSGNRRVHTEQIASGQYGQAQAPDAHHEDEYDLNQLPDEDDDQYDIQQEEQNDADVEENVDFNNYKGIYADDDAGQKYQCPETGAHFEPKDLCKRIYRIVEKRKPFEQELYGQPMLRDIVGSSLIAKAPYTNDKPKVLHSKGAASQSKADPPAPNARAGSMKQQVQQQNMQTEGAYQQPQVTQVSNHQKQNLGKQNIKNISNVEQCMSSSLLSEKIDKRHVVNLSTGNQKNIKFKNKFGEPAKPDQTQVNHMNTSQSPQKRVQTQPSNAGQAPGAIRLLQQNFTGNQAQAQNSRNGANGLPNQSLSMHVVNTNNNLGNGAQKNHSIGGNSQGNKQRQVTQQSQGSKSYYGNQQQKTASATTKGRALSHGQNPVKSGQPKDAYTMIQEQQRAEQAKQPQNQFEHQENILKQLNSDEVYNKLMGIFEEREELYAQMEKEKRKQASHTNQRLTMSAKGQKTSSAGPAARGNQQVLTQNQNQLNNVKVNPYQFNNQQSQQSIPMKNQNNTQFQQYLINQNSGPTQNSRNHGQKSGIGARLNTKNNNAVGTSAGARNNGSQFSNQTGKSPSKQGQIQQSNVFIQSNGHANKSGSSKVQKKKALNLSNTNQQIIGSAKTHTNKSYDKNQSNKLNNASQLSMHANQSVGGNGPHHNTFYGNIQNSNKHPQSRQQNALGSKGGTMTSQQSSQQQQSMISKNDIIAKYMKSMVQNQNNQIPTTNQKAQGRHPSSGGANGAFNPSQYNNFIKQAQQNSAMAQGHSRNYQNGLSSKTHTDSMIYNGQGSSIGGSFTNGLNQSGLNGHTRSSQNKTLAQNTNSLGGGRPITQSSGKIASKKKVPSGPNMGSNSFMHQSFQGNISNGLANGGNSHVINQSLKPKMIMNNNSNRFGSAQHMSQGNHQQSFQQHQGHNGDNGQIGNPGGHTSSGMRPTSSKIKKKTQSGSSGSMIAQQQKHYGTMSQGFNNPSSGYSQQQVQGINTRSKGQYSGQR